MGLFGRKKEMNNAAAVAIPNGPRPVIQPGPTTIHNHGTSWAGIIATGFVCAVVTLPVFWYALVFLFDKMGAADPEAEAAFWVVIFPALFLAGWLAKWLLLSFMDSWFSFRLDVEREATRREEVKLLAVQTTIEPGRMSESDYEFARVILAVMMTAYEWLEKESRDSFPARWRPWSRSSVLETAGKIGVSITNVQALSVAKWLADEGVITSPDMGQISKAFPNLSNVRAMLDRKYGKPIVLVSPTLRDNRGFKFVE